MTNIFYLLGSFIIFFAVVIGLLYKRVPGKPQKMFYLFCIPAISLIIYNYIGNSRQWLDYKANQQKEIEVKQKLSKFKNKDAIIVKMEQHLSRNPSSDQGWYLLGRLYATSNRYVDAKSAFYKAYQLNPNNLSYKFQYAQSIYFTNNNRLNKHATQLLEEILAQKPDSADVLSFIALDAYQNRNYKVAILYWNQLLSLLPDGSDEKLMVVKAINQAQKHYKTINISKTLEATIKLSDKLPIKKGATLYIYAKSLEKNKPPVAVLKLHTFQFPLTVSLSDKNAMISNWNLSSQDKIIIVARLSTHANVMNKVGDLQGQSKVVDLTSKLTKTILTINKAV